jgi:hypothetical protein
MIDPKNRRQFLKTAAVGGVAWSAADWAFLGTLPRVCAADTNGVADRVQFTPEIEPLVRLIEETPREQVLEKLASVIRKGTPYREVLAALQLVGIRNVQPRPSVGHKFHSVLVVNSCHLASTAGPEDERWLPIFWAVDYVKTTQAEELSKTGWKMKPVNEAKVPHGPEAAKMFAEAMDRWNLEQADVATAGIVRSLKKEEVFELFARYAARDFRDIGHKAIFLANSWRTLEVIGWQHAEPVLRSLAFAMMSHGSDPNPATKDLAADRPWKENVELLVKQPVPGGASRNDVGAANELIAGIRIGTAQDAAKNAVEILSAGVGPKSVWDGVFVSAGELLMRQPGIVALHGLTTANAVHYIASQVKDETLRQRLLLQACSFNAMFRDAAKGRGQLSDWAVADVAPLGGVSGGPFTVDEIFADVAKDKLRASRKLCSYLNAGGEPKAVLDSARRLIFQKGSNAHDYKFSSAVLEDFANVSPAFRNQFLALSVFNLKGTSDKDSGLLGRTRSALQA